MLIYHKNIYSYQNEKRLLLPYEASLQGIPCLKQSCCFRFVRVASLTIYQSTLDEALVSMKELQPRALFKIVRCDHFTTNHCPRRVNHFAITFRVALNTITVENMYIIIVCKQIEIGEYIFQILEVKIIHKKIVLKLIIH